MCISPAVITGTSVTAPVPTERTSLDIVWWEIAYMSVDTPYLSSLYAFVFPAVFAILVKESKASAIVLQSSASLGALCLT